jgi:hypothetical protein
MNMKNNFWKRLKNIQIPGTIWSPLLVGAMLGTTMVLFIKLPISRTNDNISDVNTFGKNESLDLKIKLQSGEELHLKSNWRDYYGSSPELKDDVKRLGKESFRRDILSLHKTLGRVNYEETRQLFINNVLTESLTDGTPAFYNANVLGRYYRKDYFNDS